MRRQLWKPLRQLAPKLLVAVGNELEPALDHLIQRLTGAVAGGCFGSLHASSVVMLASVHVPSAFQRGSLKVT